MSIDLRLGRKFTSFKEGGLPEHIPVIRVRPSLFGSMDLWTHEEVDAFDIEPRGFVLAQTLERVALPNDLMGLVEGRSSWARVGLSVHLTAPKIDPGFNGTITLEIANMGPAKVQLVAEEDGKRFVDPPLCVQAASDSALSGLQFQGSNSSMRLLGCSAIRWSTSVSHA